MTGYAARWAGTAAAALAAELAAWALSLAWGFAVLVAAFAVTGLHATAASAKSAATEKRLNALVPVVGQVIDSAAAAQSTASSAQSTANTALSTIPANHSFLGGLSKSSASSVGTGADAGGVPGVSAPVSGYCTVNPASQGYVNALADNVNAIRSDLIDVRNYVSAFAGTYNQTLNAIQNIQSELRAHGYSS